MAGLVSAIHVFVRKEFETLMRGHDEFVKSHPALALELKSPIGIGYWRRKIPEDAMGFGRGLLLWLLGIPLPIIILLAIFMHH